MLPFILGGLGILAVGAYLLDNAEDDYESAKREYHDEFKRSTIKINNHFEELKHNDELDKLYKLKKAKQQIFDDIDKEIKAEKRRYYDINKVLFDFKKDLNELFTQKHNANNKTEKRAIQENINIILEMRKETFKIKDDIKTNLDELDKKLKPIKDELALISSQITNLSFW